MTQPYSRTKCFEWNENFVEMDSHVACFIAAITVHTAYALFVLAAALYMKKWKLVVNGKNDVNNSFLPRLVCTSALHSAGYKQCSTTKNCNHQNKYFSSLSLKMWTIVWFFALVASAFSLSSAIPMPITMEIYRVALQLIEFNWLAWSLNWELTSCESRQYVYTYRRYIL